MPCWDHAGGLEPQPEDGRPSRSLFLYTRTENRYIVIVSRRSTATLEQDAVAALSKALGRIGVVTNLLPRETSADKLVIDVVTEVAGQRFEIEVKSVVTAAHGFLLSERMRREIPLIVISDRIATDAKEFLRYARINYFDRRGDLRIASPPLFVDTFVEPACSLARARGGPLDSQVAKEVAIVCLMTPDQPHGVRQTARYIDRAPSAVSNAMVGLKADGLLTSVGEAVVPDLFHALLMVWRPRPVALATLPDTSARETELLGLGLDQPLYTTGWALTDARAAASWGIPIVGGVDYPPDFYVPSESTLLAALSHLGEATNPVTRACTVAVAPVRLTCRQRVDHFHATGEQWPTANHIIVALDIAKNQARGLEALEQLQPEWMVRAW